MTNVIKARYSSNRTKIYACCPNCENVGKTPDTKYHLYVIPGKFVICFRCNFKSSYDQFIQIHRFSIHVDVPAAELEPQQPKPAPGPSVFDKFIKENTTQFSDSDSFYSAAACQYLHRRGLDDALIARMGVRLGTKDLHARVVFTDQVHKYFVARAFLPNVQPKTLNPSFQSVKPLMYLDSDCHRTLYLVEGTFDAVPFMKTGRGVACILGKDVSPQQMAQLQSLDVGNVVVSLDADAMRDSLKLAGKIAGVKPMSNVGAVLYNDFLKKDPGEWDTELFNHTSVEWVRVVDPEVI